MAERTVVARPTRRDERGATMVEYALLVALVAIMLVAAWAYLSSALDASVEDSGSRLDSLVEDD